MRKPALWSLAVLLLSVTSANAVVTVDRNYLFGEDGAPLAFGSEGAVAGNAVGSGNTFVDATGRTFDWEYTEFAGPDDRNTLVELQPIGTTLPVYADVTGAGLSRPLAEAGGLGVTFNGANYLHSGYVLNGNNEPTGGGLGAPQEAPELLDEFGATTGQYNGVVGRGFQMWVYPTNDTAGVRQDIVNDTFQFGVHITADNKWAMTWGSRDTARDIAGGWIPNDGIERESDVDVEFNTWTHVMNNAAAGVRNGFLFINGVAVAAGGVGNAGGYESNTLIAREWDSSQNGDDPVVQDLTLLDLTVGASLDGTSEYFSGTIDNLQTYVHNNGSLGTFNLGQDNEYVKAVLAGDIVDPRYTLPANTPIPDGDADLDGDVDDDDVMFLAQNWRATQMKELCCGIDRDDASAPLEPVMAVVGDLDSRTTIADFNFDGTTDWDDWFILRANYAGSGVPNLAAALAAVNGATAVPEPTAALMLLTAAAASPLARRQRRQSATAC